jgi:hypothetical protein
MKRERTVQVMLMLVGFYYCFWGYILFDELWHAKWLATHNDVLPMFVSLNAALGPCLLMTVKQPAMHRLMIFYGAFSSIAHASTMTIQSTQAAAQGMHRHDSPQDIVINGAMGILLLAVLGFSRGEQGPPTQLAKGDHAQHGDYR